MPKLYYLPGAVCAQKALLVVWLKEAIDAVELVAVDRAQLTTPHYLAMNAKGVVPTLADDHGNVIVESSTIMRFIDEAVAGPSLQPAALIDRCRMNNWMKLMDEDLFPAIGYFTMATLLRADMQARDPDELSRYLVRIAGPAVGAMRASAVRDGAASDAVGGAIETWNKCFAAMELALADREWLAGDALSLADAALMPAFNRLRDLGLGPWWERSFPGVSRWWSGAAARTSMPRFLERFPNPMAAGLEVAAADLRERVLT